MDFYIGHFDEEMSCMVYEAIDTPKIIIENSRYAKALREIIDLGEAVPDPTLEIEIAKKALGGE